MKKIIAPRGTKDILPPETTAWQHVESIFTKVCSLFGYQEIRIPTFEATELFQRGVGETTDVVQKEMYTFDDKGGRSMTLRPEGTAGVVRSYIENGMSSLASPVRVFYNIRAFRYEKMQKGRYREFNQFGCEVFGSAGPAVDAEIVSLLALYFAQLGLEETSLNVNSIGCKDCRKEYNSLLKAYLKPHLPDLCESCQSRFETNPLRIIDCKEASCKPIVAKAPALLDHVCPACKEHFTGFCEHLEELGINYQVDKNIVRGLDYYTRTVFEFVSSHVGTQGTICGGGRYDGLVEQIGGRPTAGIGFALGVERLLMELQEQGVKLPQPPNPTIYIALLPGGESFARSWTYKLRKMGVKAETDLMQRSLKAQLKYASRIGALYSIVMGEEEITNRRVRLKDMQTGSESEMSIEEAQDYLAAKEAGSID